MQVRETISISPGVSLLTRRNRSWDTHVPGVNLIGVLNGHVLLSFLTDATGCGL